MEAKRIYYTPTFAKNWQKLPSNIKKKAVEKEKLFRKDIFSSPLSIHKLIGNLKKYWSFSVDYHTRIVFRFLHKGEVLFVDVGSHQIYR